MSVTCEIDNVIQNLQNAAEKPEDKTLLAKALLGYLETKEDCKDAVLYQFGLPQDKKLCKELVELLKTEVWEDAVRDKAEKYLDEAGDPHSRLPYKERRDRIMDAIRLLKRLHEERKTDDEERKTDEKRPLKPETLTLLAKAYLRKSRTIYSKGRTVPARKMEAIAEGLLYAEEAIKMGGNENAYRGKAMLYVEKERILTQDERTDEILNKIKNGLKEAIDNGCTRFNVLEADVKIATLYAELNYKVKVYEDKIINAIIHSDLPDIELERARAYRLQGGPEDKLIKEIKNLMNRLNNKSQKRFIPFSDPLWDDTVRFLVMLYEDNKKDSSKFICWKELAKSAWNTSHDIEQMIVFPFHIRWYWSRMRALYDLAFLAEDDPKQKAEIADSLKSRPSMKLNVIENLTEDDDLIRDLFNEYAIACMGGYSSKYEELKSKIGEYKKDHPDRFKDLSKVRGIDDAPDGWIVIHFYLNRLEKQGYALIYNSKTKKWDEPYSFPITKLFNVYMTWQTNYNKLREIQRQIRTQQNDQNYCDYKKKATQHLENLCKKIGESMPFLFELQNMFNLQIASSSEANCPVLFVTHDFLHRLPLHGAINAAGEMFLKKHQSCYLPAWSFEVKERTPESVKGSYLIINVGMNDYGYKELINETTWDNFEKNSQPPCSLETLKNISTPPEFLAIICHGKADNVNPFNARLMLKDNTTRLMINTMDIDLSGSKIFLGACETDLAPSLSDIVDEHISISTSFFEKGAPEISGTLWFIDQGIVQGVLINECCPKPSGSLMEAIWKYQKRNIDDSLFDFLAFRIIGMPRNIAGDH